MKKQIIILTFLFTIISCKNYNKIPTSNIDPLIGTWKVKSTRINYSDGNIYEYTLTDCTEKARYTYNPDGTLFFKMFETNKKTGECKIRGTDFWTGKWSKIKQNRYETVHVHKYPSGQNSGYTDSTTVYIFSNQNNTLTKHTDYKKAGIAVDTTSKAISDTSIYTRVK